MMLCACTITNSFRSDQYSRSDENEYIIYSLRSTQSVWNTSPFELQANLALVHSFETDPILVFSDEVVDTVVILPLHTASMLQLASKAVVHESRMLLPTGI